MSTRSGKRLKELAPSEDREGKYILQLFVAGVSPNSIRAVENLNAICEKYLKGRHDLEIIDIYQQPGVALKHDIVTIPVLIKRFPLPEERLVGDLSNTKFVLKELSLT